jgi:hypothetical protein
MMDSNMNDWRMEERIEHGEEVGQVQGYAHPDDGPRRFRKDGQHGEILLICRSSVGRGCGIGLVMRKWECPSRTSRKSSSRKRMVVDACKKVIEQKMTNQRDLILATLAATFFRR